LQSKLYLFSRANLARQIVLLAATIISFVPCGAAAENAQPTPKPMMWPRAPAKGKVYNFGDLVFHEGEVAGKVVQLEVLPKAGAGHHLLLVRRRMI
jgi:hypothetical protein